MALKIPFTNITVLVLQRVFWTLLSFPLLKWLWIRLDLQKSWGLLDIRGTCTSSVLVRSNHETTNQKTTQMTFQIYWSSIISSVEIILQFFFYISPSPPYQEILIWHKGKKSAFEIVLTLYWNWIYIYRYKLLYYPKKI